MSSARIKIATRMTSLEDFPQEIQFDILGRLPSVKYVVRSRCVCKYWNTLISSQSFINVRHAKNVLMKIDGKIEYLLTGTLINQKRLSAFCAKTNAKYLDFKLPIPVEKLGSYHRIDGSCNGLLCISTRNFTSRCDSYIFLWNPSIRKFRQLPQCFFTPPGFAYIGLGFQPEKDDCDADYKVVRISVMREKSAGSFSCGVEVYSVRLNSWRRIDSTVPFSQVYFELGKSIHLNGVVYWVAREYSSAHLDPLTENISATPHCILAFDMCIETFRKILLPNEVVDTDPNIDTFSIRVLDNAISLFHSDRWPYPVDMWVLEKNNTWKYVRSVGRELKAWPLVGFTKIGGDHIAGGNSSLFLYETESPIATYIDAYRESLVLLN